MKRTQWSTLGLGLGALALGAMTLAAVASAPTLALAAPQEESVEEEKARRDALRAEIVAQQRARLAKIEQAEGSAVRERVAQAESMAMALAEEMAAKAAQEGRIRVRTPRGIVRSFGFGGSSAERVLAQAEELELTDAQRDAIRAAEKQHRRDGIEREAAIDLARLDLDELMEPRDDALDLAAVEAKLLEISRLEVQDQVADLRLRQRVRETLTPEQRDELEEMAGVFVLRDGALGWHDGEMMFDAPGRELLFELRDRMPRLEHHFLRELPEGRWFFRHDEDDDEEEGEEGEQEGEGVEIVAPGASSGASGTVIAL